MPNACMAEAEQLITKNNEVYEWIKQHRAAHHPGEPKLRRLVILADHGPEYAPLMAFAGEDPPSIEYVTNLIAQAWNLSRQGDKPTVQ